MNLHEINNAILECVDLESGEILDIDNLNQLTIARDAKIEGLALWFKNITAEAEAVKAEAKAFRERAHRLENKADGIKEYLHRALDGMKFTTTRVEIGYRKSIALAVENEERLLEWAIKESRDGLYKTTYALSKSAITEAIKSGEAIEGAALVEKNNIQIK